jgi:uncharacterized glyoxalase superfamily protein PhnB
VNWTENGTPVSTTPSYTFNVLDNRNLVANFSINTYTISTSSNPSQGGTTSGGGSFNFNQTATLTATPNTGYSFVNWTENGTPVSTNANYSFSVTTNRTLVANFRINTYTISTSSNPTQGGTTSGGGSFNFNQTATVSAIANTGYSFVNWTENGTPVSTNANYSFSVTANRTLVANFRINSFTISTSSNPTQGGTTSGGGSFNFNQTATVSAIANTGYSFVNWTENGTPVSTTPSYTFNVASNRTLVANFRIYSFIVSTSSNPSQGGTTSGGGSYNFNQTATLTATPNTGYSFVNWTENGTPVSTNANYSFSVTTNRTLVANFRINTYTISTSSNPSQGGTTSGGGSFNFNQTATVSAIANTGYSFVNWTENGTPVSTNANYSFSVTTNRTLVANFRINTYTISTSSNPTQGGTTSGGGSYNFNQTATVSAIANTGYSFVNWTENGTPVSTNANYSFSVTTNRTLVANFRINSFTISTSSNPSQGGTTSGGGSYNFNQTATLTATPNTGYSFVNWTENGTPVSTNANYSFSVTTNRTLVANFRINSFTISTSSNPTQGGNTSGGGLYNFNQTATLTATPNTGYSFVNWTENGSPVSTTPSYTFNVTSNRTLVANFRINSFTISISSNPTQGGTTTGGGSYNFNQTATVSAIANTGYSFVNWTENGTPVSTTPSYTFNVTDNRNLVANLEPTLKNLNPFYIYPNPTNDFIYVKSKEKEVKLVKIYDLLGRLILEQHFSSNNVVIDLTSLNNAVYFAEVYSEDNKKIFRIIKN